ncbi:zinc-ribbon domain-containing protein, partial [Planctomycetota bacterium]
MKGAIMYCTGCGVEISEGINFCSNCGTNLDSENTQTATAVMEPPPATPPVDYSKPILVTRPTFIPWVAIAGIIPLQIFMTIWGAGFCGGFGMFAVQALGLNLPSWFTFVFFGVLF